MSAADAAALLATAREALPALHWELTVVEERGHSQGMPVAFPSHVVAWWSCGRAPFGHVLRCPADLDPLIVNLGHVRANPERCILRRHHSEEPSR